MEELQLTEDTCFYKKSDLIYDYAWFKYADDDNRISGIPDDTFLNRAQGYEVLYIINYFAQVRSFRNKNSGVKIEKMLNVYIPSEVMSQKEVMKWIEERWFDFL